MGVTFAFGLARHYHNEIETNLKSFTFCCMLTSLPLVILWLFLLPSPYAVENPKILLNYLGLKDTEDVELEIKRIEEIKTQMRGHWVSKLYRFFSIYKNVIEILGIYIYIIYR